MLSAKYLLILSSLFSVMFVAGQAPASSLLPMQEKKTAQVKQAPQKSGPAKGPMHSVENARAYSCITPFQTNYPSIGTWDAKTRCDFQPVIKPIKPTPAKEAPAKQTLINKKPAKVIKAKPKKIHAPKMNSIPATQEEVRLLAKAVHSEARGEKFKGKVAVAAVILNRTESKEFPKTIKGVIFEPKAFTAVSDGQFELKPSQEAYDAARAALRGSDPTNGAIFYYNPQTATSGWMFEEAKKNNTTTIGKHVFFK